MQLTGFIAVVTSWNEASRCSQLRSAVSP